MSVAARTLSTPRRRGRACALPMHCSISASTSTNRRSSKASGRPRRSGTPCGRGRNLVLAEHLLELGCNPDYALWAACFNDDVDAIRLLVRNGATVDDPAVDETPFIAAVKVSHFGPAEVLLDLGADVDTRDGNGMTALHYMLRKNSDKAYVRMLVDHGARGDIPDPRVTRPRDTMGRKRDPEFKRMAEELRRR